MNRALAIALLLILPQVAVAAVAPSHRPSLTPDESAPPVQCAPAAQVFGVLRDRFGETMRWMGRDSLGTEDVLTTAPGQKTWTLLAIGKDANGDAVACILDSGGARKGAAGA